ncbi:hypothetical protein LSAT2_008818 [Lamellibrachia satsuma]|nr:hypothetical protein LSAT2_008818 [Lamellibrachia satsuma]
MTTKRNIPPLRELNPPATCTILYNPAQVTPDLIAMISDASSLLKEVLQVVRKGNADLSLECVLLSKVLYHCSSGHRMQKYYHGLKKVEKCLRHYNEMNLPAVIEEFGDTIPRHKPIGESLRLPSRQMLQFVLVRLRDAASLLCQTSSYVMQTFILVKQQMILGLFVPKMIIFEGLLSRIWIYSRAMLSCLQTWYKELNELKNHINASHADWLPQGYELPASLEGDLTWPPTHYSLAMQQMTAANQESGSSTCASQSIGSSTCAVSKASGSSTCAVSKAGGSSTSVETILQRYCSQPDALSMDDVMDDDSLLTHEPGSVQEDVGLPVSLQEDMGLPVRRQTPHTDQSCAASRRRHWLTKLKSSTDVEDMLATVEGLKKDIPGLDNRAIVQALVALRACLHNLGPMSSRARLHNHSHGPQGMPTQSRPHELPGTPTQSQSWAPGHAYTISAQWAPGHAYTISAPWAPWACLHNLSPWAHLHNLDPMGPQARLHNLGPIHVKLTEIQGKR